MWMNMWGEWMKAIQEISYKKKGKWKGPCSFLLKVFSIICVCWCAWVFPRHKQDCRGAWKKTREGGLLPGLCWKPQPASHWVVTCLHSFWVGQSSLLQTMACYLNMWLWALFLWQSPNQCWGTIMTLPGIFVLQKEEMGADTKHCSIFPLLMPMLVSVTIHSGKYAACNKSAAYLLPLH